MRQACKRFPGLPARSDSSFLSFKMCLALTARYDEQGFIHPHNQFHIVLDSLALAGLLHSVLKTLNIKDIPTIRPNDDSEDQLTGSTTHRPYQRPRDTHLHLFPSHPLQAAYLLLTPLHQRQVATG